MSKRAFRHIKSRAKGFTLVELMVTGAILVILLAIGVPQLRNFLDKQRVAADLESLVSSFQLARSEALKRSGTVSICAKTAADTPACVNGTTTDWSNGWLVFIDYGSAGAGANAFDSTVDTLLRAEGPIRSGSITLSIAKSPITFLATGFASSAGTTFRVNPEATANSTNPHRRCMVVSILGKVKFVDPADVADDGCL
ncbi:MAG: prepilin-type N-terminal cleavage/methylation domain-containing protein [Rubrivivax sp.]|nr:MAG: prepilin-type N-terminal cleavage/methylation domain-containing protein [Rubrivivax sp.]